MASSSSGTLEQGVPEAPHDGQIDLCQVANRQFLKHKVTGEATYLPEGAAWTMRLASNGYAYVARRFHNGQLETRYVSEFLSKSVHAGRSGRLFVRGTSGVYYVVG